MDRVIDAPQGRRNRTAQYSATKGAEIAEISVVRNIFIGGKDNRPPC
jgi:hypothetical protein